MPERVNDLEVLESRIRQISGSALVSQPVKDALYIMLAWVKTAEKRMAALERETNGD
jgi:hypothetical protein